MDVEGLLYVASPNVSGKRAEGERERTQVGQLSAKVPFKVGWIEQKKYVDSA